MRRAAFSQSGGVEYYGRGADPDTIYYNASIVNNATTDTGGNVDAPDPPIRFNETRDTYIVRDASKYQFSVVRFAVNGPGLNIPLLIPSIQSYTGQTNPNLTEYGVALTFNGEGLYLAPPITYLQWRPEYANSTLAPLPRSTANPNYVSTWNNATTYRPGQMVSIAIDPDPQFWLYYEAKVISPLIPPNFNQNPTTANSEYWDLIGPDNGISQDISTRYYYLNTYQHFVDLVNLTIVEAQHALWLAYNAAGGSIGNEATFNTIHPYPFMEFNPVSGLFTIFYPVGYTQNIPGQFAVGYMFMNNNMAGLFAGFDSLYVNQPYITAPYTNWDGLPINTGTPYGYGYAFRMVANVNRSGDNYFPINSVAYYTMIQNFCSTTTLWSPVDSIVFSTTLLPVQNEQTAPPNVFGSRNTGNSAPVSQAAFQPILTDVVLELTAPQGAAAYRQQIYYTPVAEYRMADFQSGYGQEIRTVDIQIYWRSRLDNNLYPLTMYNLSSVNIKLMFRKTEAAKKAEMGG